MTTGPSFLSYLKAPFSPFVYKGEFKSDIFLVIKDIPNLLFPAIKQPLHK